MSPVTSVGVAADEAPGEPAEEAADDDVIDRVDRFDLGGERTTPLTTFVVEPVVNEPPLVVRRMRRWVTGIVCWLLRTPRVFWCGEPPSGVLLLRMTPATGTPSREGDHADALRVDRPRLAVGLA